MKYDTEAERSKGENKEIVKWTEMEKENLVRKQAIVYDRVPLTASS